MKCICINFPLFQECFLSLFQRYRAHTAVNAFSNGVFWLERCDYFSKVCLQVKAPRKRPDAGPLKSPERFPAPRPRTGSELTCQTVKSIQTLMCCETCVLPHSSQPFGASGKESDREAKNDLSESKASSFRSKLARPRLEEQLSEIFRDALLSWTDRAAGNSRPNLTVSEPKSPLQPAKQGIFLSG